MAHPVAIIDHPDGQTIDGILLRYALFGANVRVATGKVQSANTKAASRAAVTGKSQLVLVAPGADWTGYTQPGEGVTVKRLAPARAESWGKPIHVYAPAAFVIRSDDDRNVGATSTLLSGWWFIASGPLGADALYAGGGNAIPAHYQARRGIPMSMAIPANYIGATDRLTAKQIVYGIRDLGWELVGHSQTHTPITSDAQAYAEIVESKAQTEALINAAMANTPVAWTLPLTYEVKSFVPPGDWVIDYALEPAEIMTIDTAPGPGAWTAGETLRGASSSNSCVIVEVVSPKVYRVKARSGNFTSGEIIASGANSVDCAGGYPTFVPEKSVEEVKNSWWAKLIEDTYEVSQWWRPLGEGPGAKRPHFQHPGVLLQRDTADADIARALALAATPGCITTILMHGVRETDLAAGDITTAQWKTLIDGLYDLMVAGKTSPLTLRGTRNVTLGAHTFPGGVPCGSMDVAGGVELVNNGAFGAVGTWVQGAGWTIGGGVAHRDVAAVTTLSQPIVPSIGHTYWVLYTLTVTAGTSMRVSLNGTNGTLRTASGTYGENIVAGASGGLVFTPTADFHGDIDNASVIEAPPSSESTCRCLVSAGHEATVVLTRDGTDPNVLHVAADETLTLDAAPTGAWAVGDKISGATSLNTCRIVRVRSTTVYDITGRTGPFTDGEVLSNGTETRDCGAGYPIVTAASDPKPGWTAPNYLLYMNATDHTNHSGSARFTVSLTPGRHYVFMCDIKEPTPGADTGDLVTIHIEAWTHNMEGNESDRTLYTYMQYRPKHDESWHTICYPFYADPALTRFSIIVQAGTYGTEKFSAQKGFAASNFRLVEVG